MVLLPEASEAPAQGAFGTLLLPMAPEFSVQGAFGTPLLPPASEVPAQGAFGTLLLRRLPFNIDETDTVSSGVAAMRLNINILHEQPA